MPKDPNEREAPITDGRGLFADELTDREGRKVRDLDRVGAMTPDTDSEDRAKRPASDDDDDDPTIEAPELVDDEEDDDKDRPDDQPR
jgi:hypothetical protein